MGQVSELPRLLASWEEFELLRRQKLRHILSMNFDTMAMYAVRTNVINVPLRNSFRSSLSFAL